MHEFQTENAYSTRNFPTSNSLDGQKSLWEHAQSSNDVSVLINRARIIREAVGSIQHDKVRQNVDKELERLIRTKNRRGKTNMYDFVPIDKAATTPIVISACLKCMPTLVNDDKSFKIWTISFIKAIIRWQAIIPSNKSTKRAILKGFIDTLVTGKKYPNAALDSALSTKSQTIAGLFEEKETSKMTYVDPGNDNYNTYGKYEQNSKNFTTSHGQCQCKYLHDGPCPERWF